MKNVGKMLSAAVLQSIGTLNEAVLLSTQNIILYGPWREKTRLRGFRQSKFQTSLLSYSDKLENCTLLKASLDIILSN